MSKLITGAKALVTIGGNICGYATGVVVSEAILNGRVETLGTVDTREIETISRIVSGSISFMRIFDKDVTEGLTYNGDGTILQRTFEVLQRDGFDLVLYSTEDGGVDENGNLVPGVGKVYTVKGCKPSSQTIAVDRGSFMGVNVTFDAKYLVKEDQDGATSFTEEN